VAVGFAEGAADGDAAEGDGAGLADGEAIGLALQPPINPTIPNATATVESFKSFIGGSVPRKLAVVRFARSAVRRGRRTPRDTAVRFPTRLGGP
jgi:hypothetical protein